MTKEIRKAVIKTGWAYTRQSVYCVMVENGRYWINRSNNWGEAFFVDFLKPDEIASIKYAPVGADD